MRSNTCHAIYGNMASKKARQWITDLVNEVSSSGSEFTTLLIGELTRQPYCGHFLTYLLFDDGAIVDGQDETIEAAFASIREIDLIDWMH